MHLFVCPDHDAPAGGIRVIYRAVDHLRAAGHDAYVVHEQRGFRPTWFHSETPVLCAADLDAVAGRDLLVVPEIYGPHLGSIAPGVDKLVFNQNTWNTFAGYEQVVRGATAYDHPEVAGAICVSDAEAETLRFAFPALDVRRITVAPDPALFAPGPKRPVLAYMPRKSPADAAQVLNLLRARGALDGVEVVALHGVDEATVAATLREAAVFLSFSVSEGLGLPPLEAMFSGCLVAGFHGVGGREFLTPRNGWPVEQGDVLALARRTEGLLAWHASDPAAATAFGVAVADRVRATYSPQAERDSVVAAFAGRVRAAA